MSFRWDQRIPEEWPAVEPMPHWLYVLLYLIVEIAAVEVGS